MRCRPWCIRKTLFMHSTALLAQYRPSQHRRDLSVPGQPIGIQLLAEFLLHQVRHVSRARDRPRDGTARPLPSQPPQSHQGLTQFLGDREPRQLTVHPVQEREALWGLKVVANCRPGPTHQPRQGGRDLGFGPGSVVESAIGRNTPKAGSACFQAASTAS